METKKKKKRKTFSTADYLKKHAENEEKRLSLDERRLALEERKQEQEATERNAMMALLTKLTEKTNK